MWAQVRALRCLSRELCGQLLAGLAQVLREERALQTLEDEVSSPGAGGPAGGARTRRLDSPSGPVPSWSRA